MDSDERHDIQHISASGLSPEDIAEQKRMRLAANPIFSIIAIILSIPSTYNFILAITYTGGGGGVSYFFKALFLLPFSGIAFAFAVNHLIILKGRKHHKAMRTLAVIALVSTIWWPLYLLAILCDFIFL